MTMNNLKQSDKGLETSEEFESEDEQDSDVANVEGRD